MSNRTVQAAAEGMPASSSAASQLGTNYLADPKASPAKLDFGDLESAISDARMFADLVLYVGERALMNDDAAMGDNRALVPVTKWERDLVMFAAEQAKKAAIAAMGELSAFVDAAR